MGADREFAGQFTIAKNFHAVRRAIGQTCIAKSGFIDARAIIELVEVLEINGDIAGCMAGIIETALGDAANEGHLAALKADTNRTAGAGSLAFAAATAGFAMAAGLALT